MSESYTCPRCGRTSHNPNDLANRFCAAGCGFEAELCPMRTIKLALGKRKRGNKPRPILCDQPLGHDGPHQAKGWTFPTQLLARPKEAPHARP